MNSLNPTRRPAAASGTPRDWYPYRDEDGTDIVTPELLSSIAPNGVAALTSEERQMRYAELQALLRSAANGSLRDDNWKPVSRDPLLWELRWHWQDGSQHRGYFHEPSLEPDSTILAKVHKKQIIHSNKRETQDRQNDAIDEAGIRIRRGKDHRWGLGEARKLN
ncbi:MAG: hypothetical protein R2722_14665 [Tessaracoccus sp.]